MAKFTQLLSSFSIFEMHYTGFLSRKESNSRCCSWVWPYQLALPWYVRESCLYWFERSQDINPCIGKILSLPLPHISRRKMTCCPTQIPSYGTIFLVIYELFLTLGPSYTVFLEEPIKIPHPQRSWEVLEQCIMYTYIKKFLLNQWLRNNIIISKE